MKKEKKQTKVNIVCSLITEGLTNSEIAEKMNMSMNHVSCIKTRYFKTGKFVIIKIKPNGKVCKSCGLEIETGTKCKFCKTTKFEKEDLKVELRNVKIGADPEFVFIRNYDIVNVNYVLGYLRNGRNQKLGTDCGNSAEIRPNAADNSKQLIINIKKLLNKAYNKAYKVNPAIRMKAGSYYDGNPLGGHIHFGVTIQRSLSEALNVISMLIDDTELQSQRMMRLSRRCNYGKIGHRDNDRATHGGFEHRLPHSWIYDPEYAYNLLSLYHTIVLEYENFGENECILALKNLYKFPAINKYNNCIVSSKIFKNKILKAIALSKVLKSDYNNYTKPVMKLLNNLSEKKDTTVNNEEWGFKLTKKRIRKTPMFNFNLNDDFLPELMEALTVVKKPEYETTRIFGLRDNPQFDISYSTDIPEDIKTKLRLFAENNNLLTLETQNYGYNKIGLTLRLRQTKFNKLKELFTRIMEVD